MFKRISTQWRRCMQFSARNVQQYFHFLASLTPLASFQDSPAVLRLPIVYSHIQRHKCYYILLPQYAHIPKRRRHYALHLMGLGQQFTCTHFLLYIFRALSASKRSVRTSWFRLFDANLCQFSVGSSKENYHCDLTTVIESNV